LYDAVAQQAPALFGVGWPRSHPLSTIKEIEGVGEPDPGPDATTLIRRCLALRRKPLSEFTTEDLRIMLGQQIAVPILLPMAVTVLADDLLAEGDYYPGDLLYAVVRLPEFRRLATYDRKS
jgi:hypothetical protein